MGVGVKSASHLQSQHSSRWVREGAGHWWESPGGGIEGMGGGRAEAQASCVINGAANTA